VAYSDPYGLKVCFFGNEKQRNELKSETEKGTNTTFDLDKDNCATNIKPQGSKLTANGQMLSDLAGDSRTFTIFCGPAGSGSEVFPLNNPGD
jgi:hypothetical protein